MPEFERITDGEFDGQEYDAAILACRAINPADYDDQRKAMWNQAIASGMTVPPTYPGHIVKQCEGCSIDVQVGPRQQEVLETQAARIYCLICAVICTAPVAGQTTLHNLGNPYKESE